MRPTMSVAARGRMKESQEYETIRCASALAVVEYTRVKAPLALAPASAPSESQSAAAEVVAARLILP